MRFELAGIAGAGIDVSNRERASERAQDFLLQTRNDGILGSWRRRWFADDAGAGDAAKDVEHDVRSRGSS
jgi:hypothetical protein